MAHGFKATKVRLAQRKVRIMVIAVGVLVVIIGIWALLASHQPPKQQSDSTGTSASPETPYNTVLNKVASLRTGRHYEEAHQVLATYAKTANRNELCKLHIQMGIFSVMLKNYDLAKIELNSVLNDTTCKNDSFAALQGLEIVAEQINDKSAIIDYLKREITQWPASDPLRDASIRDAKQQILDLGGQP